jgi:hypothetical protein
MINHKEHKGHKGKTGQVFSFVSLVSLVVLQHEVFRTMQQAQPCLANQPG